jgi:Tfp pilus assembly protein PilF
VPQACELCQRLTLHALSGEDASAALHRDSGVLRQVHSLLFHRAAHCLEAGSCAAAKDLFGAALAHAGPEARARDARALAACHSRLGMQQRAVEYLQIAARHEGQQPSSLTQLMLLQALAETGDTPQVGGNSASVAVCPSASARL